MNVNKININQSEQSYYISSDIYDVSARNNGATFESLSALLSSSNLSTLIPTAVRCGGMSIRFIQSSYNKYVQYRLMTTSFSTTEIDWEDVAIIGTDRIADKAVTTDKLAVNAMSQAMVDEVSRIEKLIYSEEGLTPLSYERVTGLIKAEDGDLDLHFGETYTHDVYEVEPNTDYRVSSSRTAISNNAYALISFFDAEGTYIKDSTVVRSMNGGSNTLDNYKVTSPSNAYTMKVASFYDISTKASKITYINKIQKNSDEIAEEKATISRIEKLIYSEEGLTPLSYERVTGLIKAEFGDLDFSFGEGYTHDVYEVEPDTDYRVSSSQTVIGSDVYALISFFDAEGTYIKDSTVVMSMNGGSNTLDNYKVISPSNAYTMKVASFVNGSTKASKITYINKIQKNSDEIAKEKATIMGTDRIADKAVTTDKLADSAMSQAMVNEVTRLDKLIYSEEDLTPLSYAYERVTGLIKAEDGDLDFSFGEGYIHDVYGVEPNTDYRVSSLQTIISSDVYALISFFDAEGTYIKDSTVVRSMNGGINTLDNYKVTSPSNAYTMKVASFDGGSTKAFKITYINKIQKNSEKIVTINEKLDISDVEISCYKNRCKKLEESNPFTYKTFDKAYIVMTIDDGNGNLPPFFDLCKALDIPLSPAVPPISMDRIFTTGYNYEDNTEITVNSRAIKDVCAEIVANGGEVLSHNFKVIGINSTDEKYLEIFRDSKIQLINYGFYPRGIIFSGGPDIDGDESISSNQTVNEKCQIYSQMYYDFSDLYGTKEPYRHRRFNLWDFGPSAHEEIENAIESAFNNISKQINNKSFIVIATHGSTDVNSIENVKNMRVFLERIKSQFVDTGQAEFTTWSEVYDSFKSSSLEQRLIALEQTKI